MEIVGGVGAIVGLAGAAGTLGREVARCIRTMRLADRDANLTQQEIATFGALLITYDQLTSQGRSSGAHVDNIAQLRAPVLEQGWYLVDEMDRLLTNVGFCSETTPETNWQRRVARFRWYLHKRDVLALCTQFNLVKMSVVAFVSCVGLRSVREDLRRICKELKALRREGRPGLEEHIERLSARRRELRRAVKQLKDEVKAARASCKAALREVQQHDVLPQALELSEQLEESTRRVSIIITERRDESSDQRPQSYSSRRTSRRSPTPDTGASRRHPTSPTEPTGPAEEAQSPSLYAPPMAERDRSISPIARVILSNRQPGSGLDHERIQYDEPDAGPNSPHEPHSPSSLGGVVPRPLSIHGSSPDDDDVVDDPMVPFEHGTYVNPENPQDRRRRRPRKRDTSE